MLSAERSLKSITSAFNDKLDPGPSRYQVLHNPTTQQLVSKNVTSIMNLRFGLYRDYSSLLRASQPFLLGVYFSLNRCHPCRSTIETKTFHLPDVVYTVEPPVSDHPKCKDLMVAYGRWSLTRIEPQGASSEKRSGDIYFNEDNLWHAISKLRHVVTKVLHTCRIF